MQSKLRILSSFEKPPLAANDVKMQPDRTGAGCSFDLITEYRKTVLFFRRTDLRLQAVKG